MARRRQDDLFFDEFGDSRFGATDDFATDGRYLPIRGGRGGGGTPAPKTTKIPIRGNGLGTSPVKETGVTKTKNLILPIGQNVTTYYELKVEQKIDGKWVQNPSASKPGDLTGLNDIKKKLISFNLDFNLEDLEIEEVKPTEPYKIRIIGDVPSDNAIKWRTNYGQTGFVLDEDDIIVFSLDKQETDPDPYIEFFGNGSVNDFTYDAVYNTRTSAGVSEKRGTNNRFNLLPGDNDITVALSKNTIRNEASEPTLKVDRTTAVFNISNPEAIRINYTTRFAESVVYSIGNVKRTIPISGTVTLTEKDFQGGLGQYTVYFQPISKRGGSGDVEKVVITVNSKAYIPGPDITHINYPQNIKGKDFAGYNVPFNISWQSINTNYVYIYAGKVSNQTFLGKYPSAGSAQFNVQNIIKKSRGNLSQNRDITALNFILVPYNSEGDVLTDGKKERITVVFDKGDLKLRRANVIRDIQKIFRKQLDKGGFDDFTSPFLTHYLHLGDGDNKLIGTWGIDDKTLSDVRVDPNTNRKIRSNIEKSIVLKLYEPLPRTLSTNDKVWISKLQSVPLVDQIVIVDDVINACTPLTPNFNLEVNDDIGYQILDDLVSSGSSTSADVINQFVSSSNFSLENLDIEFITQSSIINESGTGGYLEESGVTEYNWPEFIRHSSAEERVRNFYYKVQLIEAYDSRYTLLTSGSGTTEWTGSVSVLNEANKQLVNSNEVKNGFDAFEKFLYTSSSLSGDTYPGAGLNQLSASSDSTVTQWFNGIVYSAQEFDSLNTSRLSANLPSHIMQDNNNSEFILFFDMIGQHFDTIWVHINGLSKTKKLEHKKDIGIANDLVYHMLESLGWNADMGVQSQFLWEYAFGKHSDGTEVSSMSGKDRQSQIWRRLLNNLPYLNKHKGTKRAISAALSCYGIPASLLTVMEFGGPKDPTQSGKTKFTFEDRTAAINISGSSSIDVPWKEFSNTFSTDYPNSIELRLNTSQKQDQELISGSEWSLHLIKDTGSLSYVELRVSGSGNLYTSSTDSGSFYNEEYTQIVVNKETTDGNDVFTVYAKEGFNERLRTSVSSSLIVPGVSGWTSGSELKFGGSTLTASIDEIRLWRTPLNESRIDNHALLPDAIDGNHISSSTTDLILRHDFEYPKNRGISTDIKNVALVTSYCTGSEATNFESIVSYPFNYTSYDRTVTADVPSSGNSIGNKIRFETQEKITELSYRTRATKKSFDNAPLDSDKLGLFFSPTKEVNMDILKSLGSFNIDNYIGNPSDEYSDSYGELKTLRNYYFDRYSLNIYEYIQLVRYIDKSLFDVLESLVPARAKVASGLLIEPHMLERSKTQWKPSIATKNDYESKISVELKVNSTNDQYLGIVSSSQETSLSGENVQFTTTIDNQEFSKLVGTNVGYSGLISTEDDITVHGELSNINLSINCEFETELQGSWKNDVFEQIGNDPDSVSVAGFGLYADNANSVRTKIDKNNNFVKERIKIFLVKESYIEDVPQNIDSNDASRGREFVPQTKYRNKVSILPFTGSDGNESSAPSGTNIVSATPLDGYFPTHYRNTGDLTSGLENSFFKGSKQTASTTIDGSSPILTFSTNPNTLRVSDTGRGSGEPILEVD